MVENEKDGIEVNMGRRERGEHRNNETPEHAKILRSKDVKGSICILEGIEGSTLTRRQLSLKTSYKSNEMEAIGVKDGINWLGNLRISIS